MNNVYVTGDVAGRQEQLEEYLVSTMKYIRLKMRLSEHTIQDRFNLIDTSNEVWVIANAGHMSDATKYDIAFAEWRGIIIRYKEVPRPTPDLRNVLIIGSDYGDRVNWLRLVYSTRGHTVRKLLDREATNETCNFNLNWANIVVVVCIESMDTFMAEMIRRAKARNLTIIERGEDDD
jgi:hypothetical protein